MSGLIHELRLLARAPVAALALGLLLLLASLAVVSGSAEVARQRDTLARLAVLQQGELAALAAKPKTAGDAGAAAYYSFHSTWDAPSTSAFLALGMRDSAPYVLRVRALALQSQLHEGEAFNPALAVAGRFDLFQLCSFELAENSLANLVDQFCRRRTTQGFLRFDCTLSGHGRQQEQSQTGPAGSDHSQRHRKQRTEQRLMQADQGGADQRQTR